MKHLIVKTVIGVFLSGVILVLSSCGQDMSRKSGPESVVKEMSEGVRDFDMERIRSCLVSVDGENAEDITLPEEEYSWLMDYMKESAATIKYDITETVADGESGKVVVEYEHPDISGILSEVVKEYLGKAFAMAFSGEEFNDETAEKLLTDLFKEKTDTAEIARTATTVTFECITYGGEWKIKKMPDEMIDVLTCNCRTALSDLADIGNSQSADDRAGDEPESLSNDADGGQTSENMANEPEDGIYYKQAPVDIQTVCDNIDIKAEYAGREMAVILTNNNDFVVPDLDVTVLFYKDGALIDSDEDGHDVVLPGWSVASRISVPEGADQYK
ncbi:MAG: hypothetical protein IKS03_07665, partial [Ruminococcus sp.]|nr:hypothetical protein [Ruminococcus sp.]